MLQIAVCGNGHRETQTLAGQVRHYLDGRPLLAANVAPLESGGVLLAGAADYQVVLLDLNLPDGDGLETARALRASNPSVALILLSGSKKHAYEAYQIRAVQYLLKPPDPLELEAALEDALLMAGRGAAERFALNTTDGFRWLSLPQVVYFKSDRHVVHAMLRSGEQIISRSLRVSFTQLMRPLLEGGQFVRPHHSYAVNRDYIDRLTLDTLILRDESTVPVSRSKFASMKELLRAAPGGTR